MGEKEEIARFSVHNVDYYYYKLYVSKVLCYKVTGYEVPGYYA
jgi:hypothetical protein